MVWWCDDKKERSSNFQSQCKDPSRDVNAKHIKITKASPPVSWSQSLSSPSPPASKLWKVKSWRSALADMKQDWHRRVAADYFLFRMSPTQLKQVRRCNYCETSENNYTQEICEIIETSLTSHTNFANFTIYYYFSQVCLTIVHLDFRLRFQRLTKKAEIHACWEEGREGGEVRW